ncbi:hypothetical protein [Nocardioides litoris]|uniref:hypothetical protein n=1 Tax=Nocardioides litoris TaxID=1926648 RepID=UPI0011240B9B|nr:hypothetical protein [Nocardioides litoris]
MSARGVFFEEDDARAVADRLRAEGYDVAVVRDRLAGEDDDEDQPWAVVTDAPAVVLEVLVEQRDGWYDAAPARPEQPPRPPLDLPRAPRRLKREP